MIKLPLLSYESKKVRIPIFKNFVIILIIHLLKDSVSLIRALKKTGFNSEDIFIIGIPYSNNSEVVRKLKKEFQVYTPPFPIENHVRKIIKESTKICRKKGKKLLILEDGGYATHLIHKEDSHALKYYYGTVEQTAQGIWRNQEKDLKGPVLTVHNSSLKREIEAPEIGQAVVRNIQRLLSKRGDFIRGKNVAVIGYGTIGRKIAESLRDAGAIVNISDIEPRKLLAARFTGYNTDTSLNLIKNANIIIGSSGRQTIGLKEILAAKNNAIFVNASSKRVEINVETLEALKKKRKYTKIGTEYELINGNNVLLLAHGFPVNFHGDSESVPDKIIDVVLTELFLCAKGLVENEFPTGLHKDYDDTGKYVIRDKNGTTKVIFDENEIAEFFYSMHYS